MSKFEKNKELISPAFILLVVSLVFSVSFSSIHSAGAQVQKVATPTIKPVGGTYSVAQIVEISCSTVGATIRYTIDGTEPSSSSSVYSVPFYATGNGIFGTNKKPIWDFPLETEGAAMVKARAFKDGMTDSDVATAPYTFIIGSSKVATPKFNPSGGTYSLVQYVTLSCSTQGAIIKYTIDDSEPTSSSRIYSSPFSVTSTTTIKTKAFMNGKEDSDIASATYTITRDSSEPLPEPSPEPYRPVAPIASFWSPPVIAGVVVAAALAVIVPVTFVYRSRNKQDALPGERPLPYRSEFTDSVNKPTVTARYNQPSVYGQRARPFSQPSSYAQQTPFTKMCPRCRQNVKDDYNICPYCNKKLK